MPSCQLLTGSILIYAVKQCFDMVDISLDAELRAMQDIATILHRLDQPARFRVLHWIADRFQADAAVAANRAPAAQSAARPVNDPLSAESNDDSLSVSMLGDLFESDWSDPTTPSDEPRTEQKSILT